MRLPFNRALFVDRNLELTFINAQIKKLLTAKTLPQQERVIRYQHNAGIGYTWLCEMIKGTHSGRSGLFVFHYEVHPQPGPSAEPVGRDILTRLAQAIAGFGVSINPAVFSAKATLSQMGAYIQQALTDPSGLEQKAVLLLLFDGMEKASGDLRDILENRLLNAILNRGHALCIFFGDLDNGKVKARHNIATTDNRISWCIPRVRNAALKPLEPFTLANTIIQISLQVPGKNHLTKTIHQLSGGNPGQTYDLACMQDVEINQYALHPPTYRKYLCLRGIPVTLHPQIEALCVLCRSFTFETSEIGDLLDQFAPQANGRWDSPALQKLKGKLCDQEIDCRPLIEAKSVRFEFDPEMRQVIAEEFCTNSPARWEAIHQLMQQKCQNSSHHSHLPEDREKWQTRALHHANCAAMPEVPPYLHEEE